MLKRHMAVCLMATSLVGGAAFAQSTTAPAPTSPASPPAATAPASPSAATAPSAGASAGFVTQQSGTHWLASKLIGVDIYGSDNAKIGDISEILVDKDGQAEAVVIGVGGFLGIGQKNVALPFKSIEWMNTPPASGNTARTTSTDTTGSTSTSASPAAASTDATTRGYPDHGVVKMSKADLQNAPEFKYASEARSGSGSGTTTAPMSPTPKQ